MAKFNWDKFKSGELSVILRTKELAEDFYEKCKKHEVDWGTCNYAIWNDYHKEGIVYEFDVSTNSLVWCHTKHITGDSIEWKGENKMGKRFRELIIDGIKPGEIWENKDQRISRIYLNEYGNLQLEGEDSSFAQNYSTCIGLNATYKLKRKEYTFEEAFKAYEEGKEIESVRSGYRYKKENGEDVAILSADWQEFEYFELYEIRGKWYIND